jgi:poly(A) polymerase
MQEKELFKKINSIGKMLDMPVYVVGGYVRDSILGIDGKDIDFVVVGNAMEFADMLKKELKVKQLVRYPRFGTFMTYYKGYNLEFVNARMESYAKNSRKPETGQADLMMDLSRRDFTINTLAMDISDDGYGKIIDVFNGQADLKKGIIKTPLEAQKTFNDDPLRMMRAIRFAARLNYKIDKDVFKAIGTNAARLSIISNERIQDEFNKILLSDNPSFGINLLEESGLLKEFMPEFSELKGVDQKEEYHHKDVFFHTLEVIDNLSSGTRDLKLMLAGLLHDIAKPRTKRFIEGSGWTFHGHEVVGERMASAILKRLKYSNEIIQFVKKLVRMHLRPMALISDDVTDAAIRRLLFLAGEDFDDLMVLCRADITSKNPGRVKKYLKNYDILLKKIKEVEERDRLRNFQPPVKGGEIMKIFQCPPGPLIGKVKKFVLEAILDGDVPNEHDACIKLILNNRDKFSV